MKGSRSEDIMEQLKSVLESISGMDKMLAGSMFVFLMLGAWCDIHGNEVPDIITVPYVMTGAAAAVYHQELCLAGVIVLSGFMILQRWRPAIYLRLNRYLIEKAYCFDRNTNQDEMNEQKRNAQRFQEDKGKTVNDLVLLLLPLIAVSIPLSAMCEIDNLYAAIASAVLCISLLGYRAHLASHKESKAEVQYSQIELSAIGEADILIFLGLLGFYGLHLFLIESIVTLGGTMLLLIVYRAFSKQRRTMYPLLPAIWLLTPLRVGIMLYLQG